MWHEDSEVFSREYRIPKRFTRYLRCTAEHLVARQDHGADAADNIVAACLWCNSMRHKGRSHKAPEPNIYQAQVQRLVSAGRWHPLAASARCRSLRQLVRA
ncbi:HNH endonuclease [Massilia sp. PWRC2]|uniref:HNH endonuclease n=1 Tax=Massilia sp. PWRC2 TaxID=2804626 RepID=UPI003CF44C0D